MEELQRIYGPVVNEAFQLSFDFWLINKIDDTFSHKRKFQLSFDFWAVVQAQYSMAVSRFMFQLSFDFWMQILRRV